jgi:membrane protease YdiL (CAAX protease family)
LRAAISVVTSRLPAWLNVVLALAGPFLVAMLGTQVFAAPSLAAHAIGLAAIVLLLVAVYAIALNSEGYSFARLGFGRISWLTPLLGTALAAFFIFVFGPLASLALKSLGVTGFERGLANTTQLPMTYLILTILLVAPAEELLYRAYAIERLTDLTNSRWLAAAISVFAFTVAHVPMWGFAPALMTAVSGGILTLAYLWRRDITALIIAHVATDLFGIVVAPYLARGA